VVVATTLVLVPSGRAAQVDSPPAGVFVVCNAPPWAEGTSYAVGSRVTYNGRLYQARVAHTPPPGAGWNPAATPALWLDLGPCDGAPPPPSPTTAPPTTAPPTSPPPTGATCAVKSRPAGKVLQGYWENWDMSPTLVAQCWNAFQNNLKGLMTWSINWDGSKNWTFGDNVRSLQGR
jgi:hypothetical protein